MRYLIPARARRKQGNRKTRKPKKRRFIEKRKKKIPIEDRSMSAGIPVAVVAQQPAMVTMGVTIPKGMMPGEVGVTYFHSLRVRKITRTRSV